jgi:hypothetical protein
MMKDPSNNTKGSARGPSRDKGICVILKEYLFPKDRSIVE